MRVLPINIYKHNNSDCSNNGISANYNEVYLICEDGHIDLDENNLPNNVVRVVTKNVFDEEYKHIEPYAEKPSNKVGYMFGGCYCGCSDSRFRAISKYPLPLHDRTE